MVELLRRKAQAAGRLRQLLALGGIPGLANLVTREEILQTAYGDGVFSTVNPAGTSSADRTRKWPKGRWNCPSSTSTVKTLDQVVTTDYYLPGCAPPVKLIVDAVMAIVKGELPAARIRAGSRHGACATTARGLTASRTSR